MVTTIVLNIPKDKINTLIDKFGEKNKSEYVLFRIKKNNITITLFHTGKLTLQGNNIEELNKIKNNILNYVYSKNDDLILGFDETGRSELQGPFVISAVLGNNKNFSEVRDSKKTHNLEKSKKIVDENALAEAILILNPKLIDLLRLKGYTLNQIENEFINYISNYFKEFINFKTIVDGEPLLKESINKNEKNIEFKVKADDSIPVVSAASIISKYYRNDSKNKEIKKTWKNAD